MTSECAVCVLENGTQIEVTELMGLTLKETTCGDGNCGFPENYTKCPQDCPSGSYDGFCGRAQDGECDPDCTSEQQDVDCKGMIMETSVPAAQEIAQEMGQELLEQKLVSQKKVDQSEDVPEAAPGFGLLLAVGAILSICLIRKRT